MVDNASMLTENELYDCYPLRLNHPNEFPNIAKFSDPVDWNAIKNPLMYFKDEEIKEEDTGEVVKDAEYYKKKRNQRRSYRKKTHLVLEEMEMLDKSNKNRAIKFQGQMVNTTIADLEETEQTKHATNIANSGTVDFKYALLQCVKTEDGKTEFYVIPVGDMFLFKKASKQADELLTDIEAKYEAERQRLKDKQEKYKGIFHSLANAEKARLRGENEEEDFVGGFEGASLFSKGKAPKKGSSQSLGGSSGGNNVHINENGIDTDTLKEHDWCQGDYTSRFADDEEDNVVYEQITQNQVEDHEISASLRYDEDEARDSDEEEEDGEDEGAGGIEQDEAFSMLDEGMVRSADEARKMMGIFNKQQQIAAANIALNNSVAASAAAEGSKKRSREDRKGVSFQSATEVTSSSSSAEAKVDTTANVSVSADATSPSTPPDDKVKRPRVSFGDDKGAASTDSSEKVAAAVPSVVAPALSIVEYPLSEEGVRRFIVNRGGRVVTKDLLEFFKPKMKDYAKEMKDKAAGKERLMQAVLAVTITVEDPILGKALAVRTV